MVKSGVSEISISDGIEGLEQIVMLSSYWKGAIFVIAALIYGLPMAGEQPSAGAVERTRSQPLDPAVSSVESDDDPRAQQLLRLSARRYYVAGMYTKAYDRYLTLARQDDAEAQYYLGLMLTMGEGVAMDVETGVMWLKKSAEFGHAEAAVALSKMYGSGMGVKLDTAQAAKWLEVAVGLSEDKEDPCVED